jgi:hypothetical protein
MRRPIDRALAIAKGKATQRAVDHAKRRAQLRVWRSSRSTSHSCSYGTPDFVSGCCLLADPEHVLERLDQLGERLRQSFHGYLPSPWEDSTAAWDLL